jgi:hypothetical protein
VPPRLRQAGKGRTPEIPQECPDPNEPRLRITGGRERESLVFPEQAGHAVITIPGVHFDNF